MRPAGGRAPDARAVAAKARAQSPHAANAANIASAETDIQIAAGPSTRNGAARRAATSAPSRRSVSSTATGVVARDNGHGEPAASAAAEAEPHQEDEEQQRARRMPGDVHRPVVRRSRGGCARCTRAAARRRRSPRERCAGTRIACRGSSAMPAEPVDEGEAQHPRKPDAEDGEEQHAPAHPARKVDCVSPGEHRQARSPRPCRCRRAASIARAAAETTGRARSVPDSSGKSIASDDQQRRAIPRPIQGAAVAARERVRCRGERSVVTVRGYGAGCRPCRAEDLTNCGTSIVRGSSHLTPVPRDGRPRVGSTRGWSECTDRETAANSAPDQALRRPRLRATRGWRWSSAACSRWPS